MYLIYLLFFKAYQTITLLDGLITLNYQFIAQYVQFELQCKTQYWCAIGFGTSLYNIDLIRISNNNNNYILIQDLQERAQTSFTIPIIDDQQDIYIVNSNVTNQYLYALFQRPLQSDDPTDAIINYYSNINMIAFINTENAEFNKYSQIQRFQLQNYQCHYSCQQCQGPQSNQCILCSNNNVQVINGYCNQTYYNNVTNFYNEQIIIKDEFILQWEYTTEDIMFQIIIFKCDWFGLGFNNDIMQNTDMVQLKFYSVTNNDGDISYYVEIDDMTGLQNMAPISDTQQYGNQDWKIDSFDYGSKLYTIRIRRKLKTEDQNDYDFTIKKDIKSIYAYGYGDQQYHNANRGAFIFELSKNQLSYSLDEWDKLVYNGHLILMLIMWSLISDIGIFYGRQLKSYPKYVKIHGMIFLFITIITYFFVFSMISQQKDKIQSLGYQSTSIILHFLLGVSILLILLFQVFLGMLARNNLESPNGTYLIYKIKYIHKYLGYFLYLLTKFQVFVGLYLISQIYVGLFFIYCILLFLVKFTIEMLYCCEVSAITRRRVKYSLIEQDQQTLYESILEKLNNGTKYQEMLDDYPKIMYIVLREAVYDISDFNHPGGQYIFKKIQGKEVGRYFYGAYPLQETQLHKHSQFAINYIETRYLGDFRNESCPLFYTQQDSTKKHSFIWTLREVKQMGNGISLFRFTDSEFKVSESFNGVQWFGRYCYIKPFGIGVDFQERPYSVVQCLSQDNIKYRFELIEYFKAQNWKNPLPQQPQLSNTIQFVIKKYNAEKNFSKFIHHNNHKRFEITGPYGFGLEMDETTKGVYYVFCQGTGVLPFLDLCDYLLKKSLFIVMNQQNLNQKSQYDQLEQFKLILCVSSKTQICGYPILQDLEYLSQQFNLNNFELNIIKRHFDKSQLTDILKYKVGRIYVCGYQSYEDEMIDLLMQCGVDNKLITQI